MKPSQPQQDPEFVQRTFASIAKRYDLANHLLSMGLDFSWRRRVVQMVCARSPQRVLDLATGSGDLALALHRHIPEVIGVDFSFPMLCEARRKGMHSLICADGLNLPFQDHTFDAATIAFGLRNMASWPKAMEEISRILRPGGYFVILDFSLPLPPLRNIYRIYLHHILPKIAGILTGEPDAYTYLGDSIEQFPRGQEMLDLLQNHGFISASHTPLSTGIVSLYQATKP